MNHIRFWKAFALIALGLVLNAESVAALTPAQIDLGRVTTRRTAPFTFTVRNNGDKTLRVWKIVPSCGCTSYREAVRAFSVGPGDSQDVEFSYDTTGIYGKFEKTIEFHTSDPANPVLVGHFSGVGVEPIESSRGVVSFVRESRTERLDEDIVVHYNDPEQIPASASFDVDAPWVSARWVELDREKGKGTFRVSVDARKIPDDESSVRTIVRFRTGSTLMNVVPIPVYWSVKSPFHVVPSRLVANVSHDQQVPLRFRLLGDVPFEILDSSVADAPFAVRTVREAPGSFTVEIAPSEALAAGKYYHTFRIRTDSKLHPVVKGTFFYLVGSPK